MGLVRRKPEPEAEHPKPSVEQLDDPDPEHRRQAALGLEGVAEAVPALLDRVAAEREPQVRDAMLTTLAAVDSPAVAEALAGHLASDDAALRTAVAEALATMPVSVPAIMPGLLTDPDHRVRVMTAMILADLPHPASLMWLSDMIRDDPHPNVVAAAIDALLPSAGPQHAELLRGAARRFPDDPFLRFTVDAALR
ncbi:HEAT repeat domain-containing protein [Actinoplanes sp. TBRC 11911]|uniref:HEAT repeat domain-containing protein n=1 Tax=Actinoplanes sp. TBRC 11911 TaxID=2729386 RepID=UPI00145E2B2D|nr:HEAT repeat domain-containing protein [Actinoplanes sp. TBRC 11911]NMO54158.1 HEAT repeat domain-containing protein [Actinoplanes sp. TBRC 11911]